MTTPTTPTPALAAFLADFNPDGYVDPDQLTNDLHQLASLYYVSNRNEETDIVVSLTDYCVSKREAMRARLHGKIAIAQNFERHCDQIYTRLPEFTRW